MKRTVSFLAAWISLTFLLSGCIVINVQKSEKKGEKAPPAKVEVEEGSTEVIVE